MAKITIDNNQYEVPNNITIIQACEIAGIEIPRFCYHEKLSIAGNCRMCLVEVAGGPPKPVASCAMSVAEGMQISTNSDMVKKAREGVMEFLLANHPLDCPICDQGGECDLQDQAYQYGKGKSAFHENKRAVKDKDMGPLIKTQMTRCIHCTRCIRFVEDIAGTVELGAVNRGEKMEITSYLEKSLQSELSGNIIDLCPVGALTSKPYSFKARSWELRKTESIDVMDGMGSNIRIDSRGLEIMRILPINNEEINEEWLSDKSRFCYDGLKYQRLDSAYIKKDGKLQKTSFDEAINYLINKIKNVKASEIAALSGNLSAIEDIFAVKELLKLIGSNNFECRLSSQKIDSKDRASYLFNSKISNIDKVDACLIIGSNLRKDAPIINSKLRKYFVNNSNKIALLGLDQQQFYSGDSENNKNTTKIDLTYKYQDLGNKISTLIDILNNKHDFSAILRNAKNPMILIGEQAITGDDGIAVINLCKKIANQFNMIREDWNGFNFIAQNTGLINGLELDFTTSGGIESIYEKITNSDIKLTFLMGVDDAIDFNKIKNSFIVYFGSNGDKGANNADIILPTPAYTEKEAIFVNIEGRPQKTKKATHPLGDALDEFAIINIIASKLNVDLDFNDINSIRSKIQQYKNHLIDINNIMAANWLTSNNNIIEQDIINGNINISDYNFYLTNAIARSSKTLNRCANLINNQ